MKKAQAAMEFLMTYGWAILVVLAAIGALAYFGVLSPDRFLPSKCVITGGFSCTEYKITATGIQMKVQNNLGVDATNVSINVTGRDPNTCGPDYYVGDLSNGAATNLTNYSCSVTGKFTGDITISYRRSGESVFHSTTGSVAGNIET